MLFLIFCGGSASAAYFWKDLMDTNPVPAKEAKGKSPAQNTLQAREKTLAAKQPAVAEKPLPKDNQKAMADIIADAQETVYTIYTDNAQGSGFLYNSSGAVVTNAHVVEGASTVVVKTKDGQSLDGEMIGYSNTTDVAVIQVPALAGTAPYPHETQQPFAIGEEVIALGSPLGLENTATMGYITGTDRNFVIGQFTYNNLYQISARIAPGSSGGPLISKQSGKIAAINSAQSIADQSIGFSIPLYKVSNLIQSWIDTPMSQDAIASLFYGEDGRLFFDSFWDQEAGYFDDGDYADDESYYDYWEYEQEWDDAYQEDTDSTESDAVYDSDDPEEDADVYEQEDPLYNEDVLPEEAEDLDYTDDDSWQY